MRNIHSFRISGLASIRARTVCVDVELKVAAPVRVDVAEAVVEAVTVEVAVADEVAV
jgi:hypothetical protein